ncbi:MAG: hypothetical protein JWQ87_2240 [Candidatus Sulfotelmatobacter sp.]|nr:hypothetical protein [Candidatus Sulfotelmatobacter sp.]
MSEPVTAPSHTEVMIELLKQKAADEQSIKDREIADPFRGEEVSFTEMSKYREDGTLPERFKAVPEKKDETAPPEPPKEGKTADGQEPPKETEQEKQERERDEQGKFKAGEKEALFTPEQQKAFDKAFRKREAKIRQELQSQYAAQTSVAQGTAPVKLPETAADANGVPQRPEPPKLSTYKGTLEEYEKELTGYPAKLQAFIDATNQHQSRIQAVEKRMAESEKKTVKAHPDYKDEFAALLADIGSNEEPALPPHVLNAIRDEAEDPHALTYYLAKDRDEFRRFASLTPQQALREVLKLDVKLGLPPAPAPDKKPEPTPKPKPPEPVGARATATAFDETDEKLSPEEWAQQRNEKLAKLRRR